MPSILNATTTNGLVTSADNSGSLQLQTNNGTTAVTIDTSQNVGIGTSSPAGKLHVVGTSDQIRCGNGTNTTFLGASGSSGYTGTLTNDPFLFYTNSAERMRITSGGFVKMSDTGAYVSASGSFYEMRNSVSNNEVLVVDNRASSLPYGITCNFTGASPNNTTNYFLFCGDTTNAKAIIYSSGTVTNRTGTYNAFSDIKLKQDVVDAGSQWDDIKAVRVRKFRLKDDVAANPDAKPLIGVIAQELEQTSAGLIDDCVDKEGEVTKAVKYSILYMKAIKALQEAMERIEKLEIEVQALKGVK